MGKKLTVYMIDGTEYGPRFSEIGNWVGKAVYSPSAASNMILGRNSNGFTEWVNKDGLTFKEVQDKINEN